MLKSWFTIVLQEQQKVKRPKPRDDKIANWQINTSLCVGFCGRKIYEQRASQLEGSGKPCAWAKLPSLDLYLTWKSTCLASRCSVYTSQNTSLKSNSNVENILNANFPTYFHLNQESMHLEVMMASWFNN